MRSIATTVQVVICLAAFGALGFAARAAADPTSIPAPRLDWRPCGDGSEFACARARVPLDYRHPGRRTIELSLKKRAATGPGRRIGTLFFNPGGPGGPGAQSLSFFYPLLPRTARERFDVVSWDPRGVGDSTPVRCFDTAEEAIAWRAHIPTGVPVGSKERALWIGEWAELGRRCVARDPELARYVSTNETARDLDLLRQAVGDAQLTYYGVSYGTFLGATYANLFPGRVRALVLDGNVDPTKYVNNGDDAPPRLNTGQRFGADLGAGATLDQFIRHCGRAPIARCAFSAGTPAATRQKFDRLMSRLRDHAIGAWNYGRAANTVATEIYFLGRWASIAETLQALWERRTPASPPPFDGPPPYPGFEFEYAVVCSESPNPRRPALFQALEAFSYARAGDLGRWWAWDYEPCATWPGRAARPYVGPWNRPTASPILVVSPTFDPATPYQAAKAMVRALANARLLTLEGYGHTALINHSSCIDRHVIRYLIRGTLPPVGATCTQDSPPFAIPRS
ncbi:MAG: alpha/beta hydrolase [Geminicoccaceae bacterium]